MTTEGADVALENLGLPLSLLGSLGLFVAAYGGLEHLVHQIAYRYMGLDEEPGRAVFAGMRLGDVMSITKRLVVARKLDQQIYDDLDRLFGKVGELSTFRDKAVHRQWGKGLGGTVLENLVSAKNNASIERITISTSDLGDKVKECSSLYLILYPHLIAREVWEQRDLLPLPPNIRALLHCPWFEKPGPPATPLQQRRSIPR